MIAYGCLRKEACREHLDYINKGLLSKPNQGAKLALAYCDKRYNYTLLIVERALQNCVPLQAFIKDYPGLLHLEFGNN